MTCASWLRLRRGPCALLGLFALGVAGCLTPAQRFPLGPEVPAPDPAPDSVTVPEAYFTLHGADVRSAGWPADFARFSLFVCDPSLPPETIAQIRADLPGVKLLAYSNVQDVPLGFYPGNPYYMALDAAFDSALCLTDLANGGPVHVQGYDGTPGSGMPSYVLRDESIDVLAAFHRDVTMAKDWDGMYLDQCNAAYPNWRVAAVLAQTASFDADGDGLADRIEDVAAQYAANRPRYTQRLRAELGDAVILVANAGGALGDPELHGITLEGVGDRFTVAQARSHLAGQAAVSRAPFTAVLWATTPPSDAPSRALAAEIPGVYWGFIDPAG